MKKGKRRVLFLCTHNSCRSQMAEGWLKHYGGKQFEVFSAGTSPPGVHPMASEVMAERGIDLSGQRSKSVDEFLGRSFDFIVTTCDDVREKCPVFPGPGQGSIGVLRTRREQGVPEREMEGLTTGSGRAGRIDSFSFPVRSSMIMEIRAQ